MSNIDPKFKDIVDRRCGQGHSFDSHEVIEEYKARHPQSYAADLQRSAGASSPEQHYHSELGRQVAQVCTSQGWRGQPSRSRDVNGQSSRCVRWSKP